MNAARTTAEAMLDAHVRFELDRWDEDGLRETVVEEVGALFDRFGGVPLGDLVRVGPLRDAILDVVSGASPSAGLEDVLADGLADVHHALSRNHTRLADLVEPGDYDLAVETAVGLRRLRQEVIDQVTTSTVYARLVAHVLYNGIKNYLVSQGTLARRIPGASSMLRLGQNAVSAAAPGLERSVDRQLTAFIAANVTDTTQGSAEFLERLLDDAMIREVGAELWATYSPRTVSDLAGLAEESSVAAGLDAALGLWDAVRTSPVVAEVVAAAVDGFFEIRGAQPVAEFLAGLGVTPPDVVEMVLTVAGPVVREIRDDGYLETRIRARLAAFYRNAPNAPVG